MPDKKGFLSVKEAAALFDTAPSRGAVLRWMRIGVRDIRTVNSKKRIKLKSVTEGSWPMTRPEWVQEFKIACAQNIKPAD